MLSADADFETGARLATALGRHLDQLADSLLIEDGEWILLEDAFLQDKSEAPC